MPDFAEAFEQGLYKYMLGEPYEAYITHSATKIINRIGSAGEVLSVGCGDGSVEAALSSQYDITCYDIHDAARSAHPELNWVPQLPDRQYDAVYAHGAVFACVPHEEKQGFVDALAERVRDGGTLYLCAGYSKLNRVCRAKVFSVDGKTVTSARTNRGDDWQEITTHIWGLAKIVSTYYLAPIEDFWGDHPSRIVCTT